MTVEASRGTTRGLWGAAGANVMASGLAALAGLVLIVGAGRALTPAEYAGFASLWGLIFGLGAAAGALEAELSREQASAPGVLNRSQLAVISFVMAGSALACLGLIWLLPSLSLDGSSWLLVLTTASYPLLFAARGFAAGRFLWFVLALLTLFEAGARLLTAAGLYELGLEPSTALVGGVLAAVLVGVPVVAGAASLRPGDLSVRATSRRVVTLMGGFLLAATLTVGAPVIVDLIAAGYPAADRGNMQAAVLVSRLPLVALALVQALVVPLFVRRQSLDRNSDFTAVSVFAAAIVPLGGLTGWVLGPTILRVLYGDSFSSVSVVMALLMAGAAALAAIQVLVALGVAADRQSTALWANGAAVVVVVVVGGLTHSVPLAMSVGPVVGALVGWVFLLLSRRSGAVEEAAVRLGG